MRANISGLGMNIQKQTLHNWDLFGSRELHDKPEYTQVISFVLSQAFDSTSRFYDNRLVYDLLLGKKSQSYTIETLDVFMADLDTFKLYWGNTKTNYVDESASLVKIFEDNFDMFSHQEYFDRLKSYWLKQKIHQGLLAVLKARAEQWKKEAPNKTQDDLIDVLE